MTFPSREVLGRLVCGVVFVLSLGSQAQAGWIAGPPLPDPRWHLAAAASPEGTVMALGGRVLKGPERTYGYGLGTHALVFFDSKSGAWQSAPTMPPYVGRTISVPYSKKVAEAKRAEPGWTEPPVRPSKMFAEFELPFVSADAKGRAHFFVGFGSVFFDPRTRAWGQSEPHLHHVYPSDPNANSFDGSQPSWRRRSAGAAATGSDGRIYLVGGLGASATKRDSRRELVDGLDIYDPEKNVWKRGAAMRTPRQSFAASFGPNGKLYVFGGCACRGSAPLYKASDSAGRARVKAEAVAEERAVASTEVYDPKTDSWSLAAPMPEPRMLMAAARGADGKIYVIGGQRSWGSTPLSDVDVYEPATDHWSKGPSLGIARVGHAAVTAADGTIWVLGGYAAAPESTEVVRIMADGKEGPTASVELLRTSGTH